MMSESNISPLNQQMLNNKAYWKAEGRKILLQYGCHEDFAGIGQCMDLWKLNPAIEEQEIIDGLGFLLGELCIDQFGGEWVWVEDEHGEIPAIHQQGSDQVVYVMDAVSRRLRQHCIAEAEIPMVAETYLGTLSARH